MKILIADDDPDQLALRSMILERNGFNTVQAQDSESALRLAASEKPGCAVVDLRFPTEELGRRLLRELKALHPRIRLVLLTGKDAGTLGRLPEAHLVDGVVTKGAPLAQLLSMLNSFAVDESNDPAPDLPC